MNYWHEVALGDWLKHQERGDNYLPWRAFLRKVAAAEYEAPPKEGRGIVIVAGGRLLPGAWITINLLREYGCKLPIELWHIGAEEMPPVYRKLFAPLGVELRDAEVERKAHPCWRMGGWQAKPYAIILSRFREVLFIDADSHPLADPTFLFDEPLYKGTGTLFWPDRQRHGQEHPLWQIFGVSYRDEPQHETGQMMFDTSRCWHALQIAMHCNEYSDFYYQHSYGDTALFRMAFHMLNQPYSWLPHRLLEVPIDRAVEPLEQLAETPYLRAPGDINAVFLQRDPKGGVLFQHRCAAKFGLVDNKRVQHCEVLEEKALPMLAALRGEIERGSTFLESVLALEPEKISQRRKSAILAIFREAEARGLKQIVETGTLRQPGNWEFDGGLTYHFGNYAKRVGGRLHTVDISPDALATARKSTEAFSDSISYVECDSLKFLKEHPGQIDVLYLDSFDYDDGKWGQAQLHNLNEVVAALPKMNPRGLIAIDDCKLPGGGKGKLSIGYLVNSGWRVLEDGYICVLEKVST